MADLSAGCRAFPLLFRSPRGPPSRATVYARAPARPAPSAESARQFVAMEQAIAGITRRPRAQQVISSTGGERCSQLQNRRSQYLHCYRLLDSLELAGSRFAPGKLIRYILVHLAARENLPGAGRALNPRRRVHYGADDGEILVRRTDFANGCHPRMNPDSHAARGAVASSTQLRSLVALAANLQRRIHRLPHMIL